MKKRRDSDQFCQYHRNMFGRSLNYFDINENRNCKATNRSKRVLYLSFIISIKRVNSWCQNISYCSGIFEDVGMEETEFKLNVLYISRREMEWIF